jgi:TRAP-type mannitol/chloroaromatic compound transport system substrate-binding protein
MDMTESRASTSRRGFLAGAGVAAVAASAFPKPALAQDVRRWSMVTSWPRDLPGPGTAANAMAERITAVSGGRIEVRVHGAGEIVPAAEVFDAVADGTAEIYHSVPSYWRAKSVGALFFGSCPFGMTAQELSGWVNHGGGQALYDELYDRFGLKGFLCGNSGTQWLGWFRQPLESVDDLRGLRFRTSGLTADMFEKLGTAVAWLPGGEIFSALQAGTIDAAEFVGPWTDSALGLHQVAQYYYYPGVQSPCSAEEIGINGRVWADLPDDLKASIRIAAQSLYDEVLTEYDTRHAAALVELREEHGVQVTECPEDILIALGDAAGEVMAELREHEDELVRRITESYVDYRNKAVEYMRHSETSLMNARLLPISWG